MSSFTNVFGGSAVSPADVAFAAYSFNSNLILFWPQFAAGQTNIAARFMNLTATANSLNVFMPDATLISVGYDVIIFNAGSDSFNVVDFNGGAIATIATGQTYYLLLKNNSTQSGVWQTVQFGVGTGSASASALAGAGLIAIAGLLNVNFNATTASGNYDISSTARAILQVWIGGVGTITLPSVGSVGNGFFFPIANNGSGSVTIAASGGDLIDGASTSIFSQTQSGFIISSGTGWFTVGKGQQLNFLTTLLNLNVAGNSDVTETSAEAENIIQQYTGILTGNINVIVPATVQIYYIFNNTSGAFTLTVKTAAGSGIAVAQGAHVILYCDGTDVVNAFTSTFSGSVSISAGSASSPNFNIVGSPSTGIFSPTTNQIAFTAGGTEVMNFISDSMAVNYLQSEATATTVAPIISAKGSDTNIGITLTTKGTGSIGIAKANITGGTIDGTVIGGATSAAITGTIVTGTTLVSTISTGTAPLTVASTTQVANLNAATAGNASTVTTNANLTGPVTSVGNATSVTSNAITNAMLAQMATLTIKGNNTGGTANALDLTATQATAIINNFVGDSGSGGTKGLVPAPAAGDAVANKFLKANGTWAALGQILQQVRVETGAVATGTTIMPYDDTIPQSNEGDQYMSLAITPTSSSSALVINVVWNGSINTANSIGVALFQDSSANALAAVAQVNGFSSGLPIQAILTFPMTSGTTSTTTFKVRAGPSSSATTTFNGQGGARIFGGAMASSIIITEYAN